MTEEKATLAELYAREYDPQIQVPDWQDYVADQAAESVRVRRALGGRLDQSYGDAPLQCLDLFVPPGAAGAPIQMFIHGGGWRGSDKESRSYAAELMVPAGVIWAPINYRLAPAATLDEIVEDARLAVKWLYENAAGFGGDGERIFVTGSSAGGHLAACLLIPGWQDGLGLPADVIKGVSTISGVFDLRPLRLSGVREVLKLNEELAARLSPILHVPESDGVPLIVAWGGDESSVFKAQSRDFAAAWRAKGFAARELELAGYHHFSIMQNLAPPASVLAEALLAQMGLAPGG